MGPEYGAVAAVEKKIMRREDLEVFLGKNIIEATRNVSTHCVDGRYPEGAGLAKPGADAGDVMIVFAALEKMGISLPREDVLNLVVGVVGGPDKFSFHTDSHAEHDHKGMGMGCGHLKLALNNPDAYGVTLEDMQFLMGALPGLVDDKARMDVLEGEHEEQAVVIVESDMYSLSPKHEGFGGVQEVFVFQKTLNDERLQKIADSLMARDLGVNREKLLTALRESSEAQLMETVGRLASDLPVYTINISPDGRTFTIT